MSLSRSSIRDLLIWSCITLFYCYQYVLRMLPNIVMPELLLKFNIGAAEFGTFAGIYYIGYIFIHIPIGLLLTNYGGKLILPICILLTACGLLAFLFTDNWHYMILGRFLTGIGSSAAIVGALQIFRVVFAQHFTKMLGFMVSVSIVTAVYANSPLLEVVNALGLELAIYLLLGLGIVLALITFVLLPKHQVINERESLWKNLRNICLNYRIIILSIFGGLMVGPMEGFADAWGTGFLTTVYSFQRDDATSITLSIFTGMCLGCIIVPYCAEKYKAYYTMIIACAIGMFIGMSYLLIGNGSTAIILRTTCFLIGIFSSYQVIMISKVATFAPHTHSGTAAAVTNMIIMAFGYIFHSSIGLTMDYLWDGEIANGIKVYSSQTYIKSIAVIPAGIFIALIGMSIALNFKSFKEHNKKYSDF